MTDLRTAEIYEGPSAAARLRSLGFEAAEIIAAVQAAEIERRSCSSYEPSVAPGFKAWAAGFRSIAETKAQQGWVKTETKGLPRVLNPATSVAVAVISGDEGTGRLAGEPRSKSPRGPQSIFLVRSNEIQLGLDFGEGSRFRALPSEEEQITWWLLIFSDGDQVRAELSLPVGVGGDSRLSVWEERILVELPDLALPPSRREEEEPPLEFEIRVRPRS